MEGLGLGAGALGRDFLSLCVCVRRLFSQRVDLPLCVDTRTDTDHTPPLMRDRVSAPTQQGLRFNSTGPLLLNSCCGG